MPGAKRHTLPGSIWGQPCILGSTAWICFWPLWPQHGLIHALSGSNPQVIISIFFASDTLSNMLLQRLQITHCRRLPMLDNVGHKTVICGPESFTPDSMPLFGETPEVEMLLKSHNIENPRTIIAMFKWSQSSFRVEIQSFGICLFSRWVVSSSTVRWTLVAYNSPAAWAMRCRNF